MSAEVVWREVLARYRYPRNKKPIPPSEIRQPNKSKSYVLIIVYALFLIAMGEDAYPHRDLARKAQEGYGRRKIPVAGLGHNSSNDPIERVTVSGVRTISHRVDARRNLTRSAKRSTQVKFIQEGAMEPG